jgi:site-specific recombinase XerC
MREEVADFLHYIERRLSEMTCKAYERDVRACLAIWERNFAGRRERDRPMLALFAFAGLRRSELLGLDWDDVDLERRLLQVRTCARSRSCSATSTSTRPSVMCASPRTDSAARSNGSGSRSSGSTFRRESRSAYPKRTEGRSRGPQSL